MQPEHIKHISEKFGRDITPLGPQDRFPFDHSACLDCSSACCYSTDVLLSMHDIHRMKEAPALTQTGTTIARLFALGILRCYVGPESNAPLCIIETGKTNGRCSFIAAVCDPCTNEVQRTPDGKPKTLCALGEHKPLRCKLYPLGRVTSLGKADKTPEQQMVLQNIMCRATETAKTVTLEEFYKSNHISQEILQANLECMEALTAFHGKAIARSRFYFYMGLMYDPDFITNVLGMEAGFSIALALTKKFLSKEPFESTVH
ncbi:MAG TPA: hypothetical protein ENN18_01545 [Proteobacteria bacterium]|nr:hypothetical protein [Pseudomonadota bacterium]